jgi:hypothetical protein
VLQPVQRALAAERRTVGTPRFQPVRKQRQDRIEPQVVVIVHILVAQCQADDPLADQRPERMHHPPRIATVSEARRDPVDQADRPIRLA